MSAFFEALRCTLRTEWQYTFRSAQREHTTRYAARLWARELGKGLRDVLAEPRPGVPPRVIREHYRIDHAHTDGGREAHRAARAVPGRRGPRVPRQQVPVEAAATDHMTTHPELRRIAPEAAPCTPQERGAPHASHSAVTLTARRDGDPRR